jgi:hypothetical protein
MTTSAPASTMRCVHVLTHIQNLDYARGHFLLRPCKCAAQDPNV